MGALFLLAFLGLALLAHRGVEQALTEVAEARLRSASSRLEATLGAAPPAHLASLRALAERPALSAFLRDPDGGAERARAVLDSAVGVGPGRVALILAAARGARLVAGDSAALAFLGDSPSMGVGPFAALGDSVGYTVATPVVAGRDTVGTLVDVRLATGGSQNARLISDLIGQGASFRLGNRSGDVWTDLAHRVGGRPTSATPGGLVPFERSDAVRTLGIAAPIDGTPWILWVDLPASTVSDPLSAFRAQLAVLAVLLVACGTAGAWFLGRRISRPLTRLTRVAEAMAAGDYSRRIGSERRDEVGRLGGAFDRMAEEVAAAQHRLEERVSERTSKLRTALSDLEEAQEELVRKERLAMLGELAGGVGHELRNPLGVMTNAVFYLDAVLQERTDKVGDYLDILRRQIGTAEKIVGDLLDFARVKPPRRKPTPLLAIVDEQLRRAVPPEHVEVRRDFAADLPDADVDPAQVGQVVLNLITNALQAMEGGGALTLRGRGEGGSVRLEVEDTGPGMDEGTLSKVFEPLFTTRARGIGLGLSVSTSLAHANGGSLAARSSPGQGATFTLTLPAEASA